MTTRGLFSERELEGLRGFPVPTRQDLVRFFTLGTTDVAFVRRQRSDANRLGVAVQLCTLRWLGFVPDEVASAPAAIVERLAERLGVDPAAIESYGERSQTRTDHLVGVCEFDGWVSISPVEWKAVDEFLFARALEHDSPRVLFRAVTEFLRANRIVRPGVVWLLEHVATARDRALDETWVRVAAVLDDAWWEVLDGLLVVDSEVGVSRHEWLETAPVKSSRSSLLVEVDKLGFLRSIGADRLDVSMLPAQRRRLLARMARRSSVTALARRDPTRRYPMLACMVSEAVTGVIDETLGLFDRLLGERDTAARAAMTARLAERALRTEQRQRLLDEVLGLALDDEIATDQLGALIREGIGRSRLQAAWEARPQQLHSDHGHLDALAADLGGIRRIAQPVLATVEFRGGPGAADLLEAVEVLAGLYRSRKQHVPVDAPVSFVPARWASYLHAAVIAGDRSRYRRVWEVCVVFGLRDRLRSGDVYVESSRRFGDPTAQLMPPERWTATRDEYCALIGRPSSGRAAIEAITTELADAIDGLDEALRDVDQPGAVRVDDTGELIVPRLQAEPAPAGVDDLRQAISGLIPTLTLGSMLVELQSRTGVLDHFEHAGGVTARPDELARNLIYVIVAEATNIGLTAMARASDATYDALAWTAEWYLNDDNLEAANTTLVNYHHRLPLADTFGPGTLSSSDGQRFPVRSGSVTARQLSRYFGRGQGVSTYTHVSDQHTTFATKVIPATAHESHHVLDDLLDNATDLPIAEHATDTHGATLANFALFDLVGLRLTPRIRDLGNITLCRTNSRQQALERWPTAGPLLTKRANLDLINQQWDELLRVAASVKHGHVTASTVVGKLCSTHRLRNDLTAAIREYGTIRRTIFAARHLTDDAERRRTQRQLNKGENLHGLRRAIAYAAGNGLRSSDHMTHTQQMWCLTLLTNAVVAWTTEYYARAVAHLEAHGRTIDIDHLAHIWPTRHANLNVYGIQTIDIDQELARLDPDGYRPLSTRH
ncbi:MAG: Tn3 family transposase [Desertimonas sp.]